MFKRNALSLALLALASIAMAHAGHDHEKGVFDPPHEGAFAKMAGHYAEVWLQDGKLNLCLEEDSGEPAGETHNPKNLVLKVSPKGEKPVTLKAPAATAGCASWDFVTKAKLLKIEIQATVAGKKATAKLAYEVKPAKAGGPQAMAPKYSCPMHPDVISDKPGKCPKCGMDLVAMKGGDDHADHDHKD